MKKLILLVFAATLLCSVEQAAAWGRKGHETIVQLAERHLTKRAKKQIEKYLDGHSIVDYAKWMDDMRRTPEYAFTNSWHTAPVDSSLYYRDAMLTSKGNAIYGLELAIRNLENYKSLPDSAVAVNIKYVLHLVADMHCPGHVKYKTHNMKYNVWLENAAQKPKKVNIHSVWDSGIITQTRSCSFAEWADSLDTFGKKERAALVTGSPRDWMHENAVLCEVQFDWAKPNSHLGQDFLNQALPLVESQIQKAGYRLARVLNDLFD